MLWRDTLVLQTLIIMHSAVGLYAVEVALWMLPSSKVSGDGDKRVSVPLTTTQALWSCPWFYVSEKCSDRARPRQKRA